MKDVIYAKKELKGNRGRVVTVRESLPDSDCDTNIRKSFVYLASRVDMVPEKVGSPEIRVIKVVDTHLQREAFCLRVKGTIYVKQGRFVHRIDYLHTLLVKIFWKTHVLSSDPAPLA